MSALRRRAAVVGIGHTGCEKQSPVGSATLWVRACREAVDDAGVSLSDVDGICTIPSSPLTDRVVPTPYYLAEALGLPGLSWHGGPLGGGVAVGLLGAAVEAVASGQCRNALAVHTMSSRGDHALPHNYFGGTRPGGNLAFTAPYGYNVFLQYIASWYSRMLAMNGVRREHLARLAVDQRRSAQLNPKAVFRSPLSVDEYLDARWLAEPMCLYDADMPVDVAVAFLVTSTDRAADCRQKPVHVAHVGSWFGPRPDFIFHHDYAEMFPKRYADEFWGRAGCSPRELSCAQLHDGFSIYVLYWLESMGIVGTGEAGEFVGSGALSREGGSLPTNTHGGNLSEGRLQGGGHVFEAVLQLRGDAGPRQVPDAEVCLVTVGGSPTQGAAVLHR